MGIIKKAFVGISKFIKLVISWFSGDFILKKGLNRHIGFYFYIFCIFCVIIIWSLYVEGCLVTVEQNKKSIESLEIAYHQKNIELVSLDERGRVETLLRKYNSKLAPPAEPARVLGKE